eukprot:m.356099 g.356099  ORF g.356099 m.356099 type:complete len:780 (-) comp20745_c0_seq2:34-2373(-)
MARCTSAFFIGSLVWVVTQGITQSNKEDDGSSSVLVYGGTEGGAIAAIGLARTTRQHNLSAQIWLIEPTSTIGGMLSAGMNDDSNRGQVRAYGGLAAEFFRRVAVQYNVSAAQNASCFNGEPHVVEATFRAWLHDEGVRVLDNTWITHVNLTSTTRVIRAVTLSTGEVVHGAAYIDASYEGDLLAMSGVPMTVGREPREQYNESLAGMLLCTSTYEHFQVPVRATVNGSNSTLLPGVDSWSNMSAGQGDHRLQSFNFRACLTSADGVAIAKPVGYTRDTYVLVERYLAAMQAARKRVTLNQLFNCHAYASHKCDTNDGPPVGINPMGQETFSWPTATPLQRRHLRDVFAKYTLGLWYFLGNDASVPASVRTAMRALRLCRDEWPDLGHLPSIPYVREGRRMVSDNVFTQEDYNVRSGANLPRGTSGIRSSVNNVSVGLGFWFIDCHAVQHVSVNGIVHNEGCIQNGRDRMDAGDVFEIPLAILVPPAMSVSNLVSVCTPSASHVGFNALRVAPTYMTLGHSAAVSVALALSTARHALNATVDVRAVDARVLQATLRAQGQVLTTHDMPAGNFTVNVSCGGSPAPPPPTNGAVVVQPCAAATPSASEQWWVVPDGTVRQGGITGATCLTVLSSEAVPGHGISVGVATCMAPVGDHQKWLPGTAATDQLGKDHSGRTRDPINGFSNRTLLSAAPAPCFDPYQNLTCSCLTALAWQHTTKQLTMLWGNFSQHDDSAHPNRWTYDASTHAIRTTTGLCLAAPTPPSQLLPPIDDVHEQHGSAQ